MKSLWRSPRPLRQKETLVTAGDYLSTITVQSKTIPGVRFTIRRMSFGRRMELCRAIRELSRKLDYVRAGEDLEDKAETTILGIEIDQLYLRWGLVDVRGLAIDGEQAGLEALIEKGPEALVREMVLAIHAQCGLTEEERKN